MRRFVDREISDSVAIAWEEHRAHRGVFNRVKWAIAYFLVASADYRISRMLNFGAERR